VGVVSTPAVETDMPTILKNGRALWLILEAAELRGLPLPFAIRADDVYDNYATLQFHSWDAVVTWAEALEAEVDTALGKAVGEWFEVTVEVCTTDRPVTP
jgi:hypothetical protein